MKIDMMVSGLKILNDDVMEIELVELAVAKQKTNIMDLISKGDLKQVVNSVGAAAKQHRHRLYISRQWCSDHNILPFSSLEVEINPADKNKVFDAYVKP